jgi:hypothetical protein
MSYRNPRQFIDTQSGQHYMNLVKDLNKVGEDYTRSIVAQNAANAERNNKIISEAFEKQQDIQNKQGNVVAGNQAFDYGKGFDSYISSYANLQIGVESGTSKNPVADRKRMAEIMALPTMAREALTGLVDITTGFTEKVENAGKLGGVDLAGMKEEDLKSLMTFIDQLKGVRSFDVKEVNGKLEPVYKLGNKSYTHTEVLSYIEGPLSGGVYNTIPNETKDWTKAVGLAMIKDPNNIDKKILDSKYLSSEVKRTKPDEKGIIVSYREIDREKLKNSPTGQTLLADADALTNADKISLYNNIIGGKNKEEPNFEYGKVLNANEEKIFKEAYIDYALSNYIQQQYEVGREKIEKPTATERKTAKTAKEIVEAAPQVYTDIFKNPESYFKNKKIGGKDVLKVEVSPGVSTASDGEVYPVIELGYKSGSKVDGEEQTIFTTDMSFDLSDPARVRALIDMLPENDDIKKEIKKLYTNNPLGVLVPYEQKPLLPGLSIN